MVTARRVMHTLDVARWRLSRLLGLPPLEMIGWGALFWGAVSIGAGVGMALDLITLAAPPPADGPQVAIINIWIQIGIMVVSALISYALTPKPKTPEAITAQAPVVEDGKGIIRIYGTVWVDDSIILGWKQMGTDPIRKKGGKK